ncbi:MAG TPA: hypothetical protein VMY76_06085 [Gemmatimonadales bacterium]|nr:hypothetical protein [Gemmatimonadales bacterium]
MTNPLAAADFFALEAGECLDRLESMMGRSDGPPAEEFLRTARVLRGSALMAGQQPIARAAAGLEGLARAHRDGRRPWDAATREQLMQAVEEFRLLVRRVREWGEPETARTVRLGLSLESLAGRSAGPEGSRRDAHGDLNAGVRAFVAREGALIASALDRAAHALRVSPGDREPLYTVIRRMQSLRGLAELSELAPLPEILDGIELAVGDLTRLFAPPPGVDEVMAAASVALTRISRDIAERGPPDPDTAEARRFTELLLRAFAVERDVVPIESLYFTGDSEPVTPPATQPQFAAPAPLGPLELVSHGEHLCQSAELIAASRSDIERDLRLYRLLGTLRSAGTPGPDPVAGALVVFARSAREALAAGVATRATPALVSCLREAGELLRAVADADDRMLISRRILDAAYRLDGLRLSEASPAPAHPPAAAPAEVTEWRVVPIETLLYDETLIVSIDSLAYDPTPAEPAPPMPDGEPEPVPIASLAPAGGLEGSFQTYDRLRRERGREPASLETLVGRALAATSPSVTQEDTVTIEIGVLTYRGRAALERAAAVRQQLADELARNGGLEAIQPLLQELLDLVPLALAES